MEKPLHPDQARLVELIRDIQFGHIENLVISKGLPLFNPLPVVVEDFKVAARAMPPPRESARHRVKWEAFFEKLEEVGDGTVKRIEIQHGVPFRVKFIKALKP